MQACERLAVAVSLCGNDLASKCESAVPLDPPSQGKRCAAECGELRSVHQCLCRGLHRVSGPRAHNSTGTLLHGSSVATARAALCSLHGDSALAYFPRKMSLVCFRRRGCGSKLFVCCPPCRCTGPPSTRSFSGSSVYVLYTRIYVHIYIYIHKPLGSR